MTDFAPGPFLSFGQRVVIRLRAECPMYRDGWHPTEGIYGHHPDEEGREGIIVGHIRDHCLPAQKGHPYFVHLDEPILFPEGYQMNAHAYAPTEIDPLPMPGDWMRDAGYLARMEALADTDVTGTERIARGAFGSLAIPERR